MATNQESAIALVDIGCRGLAAHEENEVLGVENKRGREAAAGHRQEFSLPQADTGKEVWLVLGGCFMLEVLVWGKLAFSFT